MVRLAAAAIVLVACSSPRKRREEPSASATGSAVVVAPTAQGSGSASPLVEALKLAGGSEPDWDASIAKLEAMRGSAAAGDQLMYDQLLTVMRESKAALSDAPHEREHLSKALKTMIDAIRAMIDKSAGDVATERVLISSLSMLPYQIENLEIADQFDVAALRKEALVRGRALVKAFPKDAQAWRLLGFLEKQNASEHGSSIAAMRAYQTCVKLDASRSDCAKSLAELRDTYLTGYCEGPQIKAGLGWYEASETKTEATPKFTSSDVMRLRESVSHISGMPDVSAVTIELQPQAVKPMAQWIQDIQNRHHWMSLRLGARELVNTHDTSFAYQEQSEVQITHVVLADICSSPSHQTLPEDLR